MTEEEELYINNNIDNYINIHNVKELEVKQEYHAVIDGLSVFSFTGEIKEEVKKYHEFYNDESGHEDPRFGVYKKNVNDNILINPMFFNQMSYVLLIFFGIFNFL